VPRGSDVALDRRGGVAFNDGAQAAGLDCCSGEMQAIDRSVSPLDTKTFRLEMRVDKYRREREKP
jgi:hypothetical protein